VRARGGMVSHGHLLTTLSTAPAEFSALLQLLILTPTKLFAADGTPNAGFGANATGFVVQIGPSKHEIDTRVAEFSTILK